MDENAFNTYMSKLGNPQTTPTGQSPYPIKPLAIMSPSMSNASLMHQNYHTPIGSQSQSSSDVEYLGLKPTAPSTTTPPNQQLAAAAFAFYTSLFNQQQNTAALNLFHQAYTENNNNNNAENKNNDASFNPIYHFPDSSSSNHRIMNEKYIF